MQRRSFDRTISYLGLTLTVLLIVAGSLLTWATIAGIAAFAAFLDAAVMLLLAGLGFWHSRRVDSEATVFDGGHEVIQPAAG